MLQHEIGLHLDRADRQGKEAAVRINGTSDIDVPETLMRWYPRVQFYDYTKRLDKALKWARGEYPENYHVTFSRSECNEDEVRQVCEVGGNVAVVFDTLPDTFQELPVLDGDLTDLRYTDPKGVVVGLTPKGRNGKRDKSGFVVHTT